MNISYVYNNLPLKIVFYFKTIEEKKVSKEQIQEPEDTS